MFRSCGRNFNVEHGADFGVGSMISIGDHSGLGVNCWIRGDVSIGDNVMMGPYVIIIATDHIHDRTDVPMCKQGMRESVPIVIEEDVWIGARVTILKGVTVHKGSILAAGSVVCRDVPAYSVVAGIPAEVIRNRLTDKTVKK
jgi:maltose O-acetyltransferase